VALFDWHRDSTAITWQEFTTELAADVKKAFLDSHPEGYKFSPPLNGIVQQTTQTIEIYGTLPGIAPAPAAVAPQGPRFGVRAVSLHGGGVRVTYVLAGGPGAKAGFEVGDIITEINGKTIQNEEDYSKAIDDSPKQVNAKVINVKDGRLLNVNFELGY
jgi:S1-C subfamily serine protease